MPWRDDYDQQLAGTNCAMCTEGRPDVRAGGVRILAGIVSDVYLAKQALVRGYAIQIWRGRHVVEPTRLSDAEAAAYWAETLAVGRAIESHFRPLKMNYQTLGNGAPHLHTHITARYPDDVGAGGPLPVGPLKSHPDKELHGDAAALRRILSGASTN